MSCMPCSPTAGVSLAVCGRVCIPSKRALLFLLVITLKSKLG